MNFDEIKARLQNFRVGIAGAGGLGSNCAHALARSGVGTLVIADFDIVNESNLNRQFFFYNQIGMKKVVALKENLLKVNPSVNVIIHEDVLNNENIPLIYTGCDVIVEAFDGSEMKEMIVGIVSRALPSVPLVIGSGLAGWGRNNDIRSRKIDEKLYVAGDETTEISAELPPLAPRVGIVANMQANIVLDLLLNK
ncbi:MAG: sulfur carrier protein ThiS adenylyltransferase ThiF [Bacteroidales bacterium]